jgi:hypothetical protein
LKINQRSLPALSLLLGQGSCPMLDSQTAKDSSMASLPTADKRFTSSQTVNKDLAMPRNAAAFHLLANAQAVLINIFLGVVMRTRFDQEFPAPYEVGNVLISCFLID